VNGGCVEDGFTRGKAEERYDSRGGEAAAEVFSAERF
jgi:hypothetical protein